MLSCCLSAAFLCAEFRPSFFHPLVFDSALRHITRFNDDLHFRASTLRHHPPVPVYSACVAASVKLKAEETGGGGVASPHLELYSHNKNRNSLLWEEALQYVTEHYPPGALPPAPSDGSSLTSLPLPLPDLIGEALIRERNISASACAASKVSFTVERMFRTANDCGVYSCSLSDQLIRRVVRDDPLEFLVRAGQLLVLLLACWTMVRWGFCLFFIRRSGTLGVGGWVTELKEKIFGKENFMALKLKQ